MPYRAHAHAAGTCSKRRKAIELGGATKGSVLLLWRGWSGGTTPPEEASGAPLSRTLRVSRSRGEAPPPTSTHSSRGSFVATNPEARVTVTEADASPRLARPTCRPHEAGCEVAEGAGNRGVEAVPACRVQVMRQGLTTRRPRGSHAANERSSRWMSSTITAGRAANSTRVGGCSIRAPLAWWPPPWPPSPPPSTTARHSSATK
eukprot:scaffold99593_cov72-Phaeocystis_antarctica.AAC.1